jgi:hypothetical protein
VLATCLLVVVGLLARGRLLDPRRFRARDVWRPAVTLPAAMVLGVAGVLAGFNPLAGLIAASVLLYGLVQLSPRPEPIGLGRSSSWAWGIPTGLLVAATVGLAIWAAWHGLLDHPVLPPPAIGGSA